MIEYIVSAPTPQNIRAQTIFSHSLVQLLRGKKFAEETTLQLPFDYASIGNVH
jgi:hypothetical protein